MQESSTLRTERLVLRPLVPDDADEMFDVLGDERMYEFTGGRPPTRAQLRDRYERLAAGRSPDGEQRWFNWIVRQHGDETPVGVTQATVVGDGTTADVAWEIGVASQGHGFASEAAIAMVDWLIDQGVNTINAYVHPAHAASERVAERAGLSPTDEMVDGERRWYRQVGHSGHGR